MTPERAALVAAVLAVAVGGWLLMLKGWRRQADRHADLPALPVPAGEAPLVLGAVPGLFVGTVVAGSTFTDRVVVHGLSHRAAGELSVRGDGVHVARDGVEPLFLPFAAIEEAEVGAALAGKVVGRGGLLLVTWTHGGLRMTSAFRADDHAVHALLADAVRARRASPAQTRQIPRPTQPQEAS